MNTDSETSNARRQESGTSATGLYHAGWQRVKRIVETVLRGANRLLEAVACSISNSSPIKLLNALQSVAVIIAVITFIVDLPARRDERLARQEERLARREEQAARRLTAVSNAYSIIAEVSRSSSTTSDDQQTPSRRQMIALEELHRYSVIDGGRYLAQLKADNVRFDATTRRTYYRSGCDEEYNPVRVVLRGAYLDRASLNGTSFVLADLSDAHLHFAELMGAKLSYACLQRANLTSANLKRARLEHSDLSYANLLNANLTGAYVVQADLSYADLPLVNLANADLRAVNFANAYLGEVDFSNSDLTGVNFSYANLTEVNFSDAILKEVNFSDANLREVKGLTQGQLDVACILPQSSGLRNLPIGLQPPKSHERCGEFFRE